METVTSSTNTEANLKDTFYFIPHTHWEGAVFKTREAYLEMGLPNILRALKLLRRYPDYRFVLDQACYVKPFLERYPEEQATFRQLVDEGRLAIVGGTDVMLDVNMPGGESFVRQVLYGKRFFRKTLNVDVTVGWQLDTFGHHAQMPQLMKLAGYHSFWFFRGVADWNVPAEFMWEGIDGTQIPAFWLPHGYAVTYGSPATPAEFVNFFNEKFDLLAPFARGEGRVGLAGADVCEPEEHVPLLVEAFNREADAPFHLRIATPADYEAAVAQRPDRPPVMRGELNPIFQGAYSSRITVKQRTRELERLLTTAEKLAVIQNWLGIATDDEALWQAWEPMLFNQTHDLMSGVMTDHVYEDTLRSFDFSQRIAEEQMEAGLQGLASAIDTQGAGLALVVYNTLSWPRSDIAVAQVAFTDPDVMDLAVVDEAGQPVTVQLLAAERDRGGSLLQARIAFVARDVPALGYVTYRVLPLKRVANPSVQPADAGTNVIENEHYRIEFDLASGAMTRLTHKDQAWEVLGGPGNVVALEPDHGDLWELYQPLDGGSRIAMKQPHRAPQAGEAIFSNAPGDASDAPGSDAPGMVSCGPVISEYSVTHAFGRGGRYSTSVRVYPGLQRIDIRTHILNNAEFVRYRVLFPSTIQNGQIVHEIPFGASAQPEAIEFPAQHWIDYSDVDNGLALLNRGLPGNNVAGGTLMLSLLRSTRIVAYGFGGGYEPGMSSDSGLELGKSFTLDYALVPHAGNWQQAGIYRSGWEFNHPLIARTAAADTGTLPARWGLVQISHPNVIVSALKSGQDGSAVLRLYEAAGQAASGARITFATPVNAAEDVNLMEDPGQALAVAGNTLQLDLRPYEIRTIKLKLQSLRRP